MRFSASTMRHLCLAAVVLTGCAPTPSILPSTSPAQTSQPGADKIRLVDHHVHLFSAPVREWLETELKLSPLPPSGLDEFMAVMQQDGVTKAAVLSNAYFFGKDTDKHPHDLQVLREENDRIAAAVAEHPDRLVGFFSVNPLMNAARAEIDRCARSRKFVGLKLHLANSQVDLRNPAHVERVAAVFERANALHLAIAIHMRTQRPDYGREDAQIFIDRVLSKAPDVPIQIAHLAGWGGYDPQTDSALSAFIDSADSRSVDHVYFDVSAVVRAVRSAGNISKGTSRGGSTDRDWWPEQRYAQAVERLRKIGMHRLLFGTDWPEWTPRSYAIDLGKNLPLTAAELRTLLRNRAPWLK